MYFVLCVTITRHCAVTPPSKSPNPKNPESPQSYQQPQALSLSAVSAFQGNFGTEPPHLGKLANWRKILCINSYRRLRLGALACGVVGGEVFVGQMSTRELCLEAKSNTGQQIRAQTLRISIHYRLNYFITLWTPGCFSHLLASFENKDPCFCIGVDIAEGSKF